MRWMPPTCCIWTNWHFIPPWINFCLRLTILGYPICQMTAEQKPRLLMDPRFQHSTLATRLTSYRTCHHAARTKGPLLFQRKAWLKLHQIPLSGFPVTFPWRSFMRSTKKLGCRWCLWAGLRRKMAGNGAVELSSTFQTFWPREHLASRGKWNWWIETWSSMEGYHWCIWEEWKYYGICLWPTRSWAWQDCGARLWNSASILSGCVLTVGGGFPYGWWLAEMVLPSWTGNNRNDDASHGSVCHTSRCLEFPRKRRKQIVDFISSQRHKRGLNWVSTWMFHGKPASVWLLCICQDQSRSCDHLWIQETHGHNMFCNILLVKQSTCCPLVFCIRSTMFEMLLLWRRILEVLS